MSGPVPDLARLGGKGANLVRLAEAGLPVPPFATIDTAEYTAFVASAGLAPVIAEALRGPAAAASEVIRRAFRQAALPAAQYERLLQAVVPLLEGPVAVRSSATAEDLPGFSFAGQQDTFLGVEGLPAVLEAVVECWSSLWTERAITYRTRNGIGHDGIALAVLVQQMVDADAAGVLFTANPRTGRRDELVVDATSGLGEKLVSGQVTPDTFTLDPVTGAVRERQVAGAAASVTDAHLHDLAVLGRRIATLYGEPMDIEWAVADDAPWVLQARPVTSLYPLPEPPVRAVPGEEPEVWFSFGAFQGLLEPITPLGQDMLRLLLSGLPRLVGRRVDWRAVRGVLPAGERLWLRVDPLLRIGASRRILLGALPMIEPSVGSILTGLADEPGLRVTRPVPRPAVAVGLAQLAAKVMPRVRAAQVDPVGARTHVERVCERLVTRLGRTFAATERGATPQERLTLRVRAMEDMAARTFPTLIPAFAPVMGPTMLLLRGLREDARRTGLPDADALALTVMRALPGNVTTEMDLALSDVAAAIRADATAWGWVSETEAADLTRQFRHGNLPRVAQEAIAGFLERYGMRGVAEIDLGAARWRDDPTPVMHTLKAYVAVADAGHQPRAVHLAGQHEAGRSIRTLMDASPRRRAERIRTRAKVIRGMFGARETPKFAIVRAFGLLRDQLDASGRDLVEAGRLAEASDIYFLHLDELRHAFAADWHQVVAARREQHRLEHRRAQVPRVLVSDGRTFYEGLSGEGDLSGSGVSPGVAEGPVHVIRDPREQQLSPGEVLVCVGTDPAWTPLFLSAAGLITEVGGLMTHGSVVAREYGIPAVVGVHQATTRLVDGQRVRLDGTSGVIDLL